VTENRIQILVKNRRLQVELDADKADLEVTLAQALDAREEQERQAQHLRELRRAQTAKLADPSVQIDALRTEAAAIRAEARRLRSSTLQTLLRPFRRASEVRDPRAGSAGRSPRGTASTGGGCTRASDIDCTSGAPIRASKAGTVVTAGFDGGYGYQVVIDHGGGFASPYAHDSNVNVVTGESVSQGEAIGACGTTGQSTGDHVHFENRVNGSTQDPLGYLP
jgi:murein DD-endopeptidase MepM/ murein hydrolase activator NlpD